MRSYATNPYTASGRTVSFYIPADFNIDEHLENFPPQIQNFDADKLLYIIHLIFYLPTVNEDTKNAAGYIHLHSRLLRSKIGSNYASYISYLKRTGVIEQLANRYSTLLQFSKSYRINRDYFSNRFRRLVRNANSKFLTSLLKLSKTRKDDLRVLTTDYKYITKWLDHDVTVDFLEAQRYVQQITLDQLRVPYVIDSDKFNSDLSTILIALDRINNGDITFLIDKTSGRFHSNLTNFKKEFRHFIRYKGQPLVSLDIRCCQPYLMQVLLNPHFWDSRTNSPKRKPGRKPAVKAAMPTGALGWLSKIRMVEQDRIGLFMTDPIRFEDVIDRIDPELAAAARRGRDSIVMCQYGNYIGGNQSINDFVNSVNGSDIYEQFLHFMNDNKDSDERLRELLVKTKIILDRDTIKGLTMRALYAPIRSFSRLTHLAHYMLKQQFPDVYEFLSILKRIERRTNVGEQKKTEYRVPSILLQAIESEIMINRVCQKIANKNRRIPFFTVHDSILTTEQHKSTVEQILRDEFHAAIGFPPEVKCERLTFDELRKKPLPILGVRDRDIKIRVSKKPASV